MIIRFLITVRLRTIPFYPCYFNAFNMSSERIASEIFKVRGNPGAKRVLKSPPYDGIIEWAFFKMGRVIFFAPMVFEGKLLVVNQ